MKLLILAVVAGFGIAGLPIHGHSFLVGGSGADRVPRYVWSSGASVGEFVSAGSAGLDDTIGALLGVFVPAGAKGLSGDASSTFGPSATEACCFIDGSCSDSAPADCSAAGGTPQGPGTTCATTTCPPPPAPLADYGDAPDGILACEGTPFCTILANYPTLFGTANAAPERTGPYHTDFTDVWLGPQPNTATAETAPFQPCCSWLTPPPDADNGPIVLCLDPACTTGVLSVPSSAPGANWEEVNVPFGTTPAGFGYWLFEVSVGAGAPADLPRFVNVVVDWTLSGTYGDVPGEWVVIDAPVAAVPGGTSVMTTGVFPTPTVIPNPLSPLGWAIEPFWTRFTVSRDSIAPAFPAGNWDGSGPLGGYVWGETEDLLPWTDPGSQPGFPDCDQNNVPDLVDIAMGRLLDANNNHIPDICDRAVLISCSDATAGTVEVSLSPPGETFALTLPGDVTAAQKRDQLLSFLATQLPEHYAAAAGPDTLSLSGFRPGTTVRFATGQTAELADRITTGGLRNGQIVFANTFSPFDQAGQPAIFTAGIVTDMGELTAKVSAQDLSFQTDGPIICQALFQRLAPRAPQYGAQINYAGDRLEVYFDPAYTVTQGGIVFGTNSPTDGCSGQITVPCHPADFDCDTDVDADDLLLFESCASGPAIPRGGSPTCQQADFDSDGDVDQTDFGFFQRCYSGEGIPADPGCVERPGSIVGRAWIDTTGEAVCAGPLEPLAEMEVRLMSGEQEIASTQTDVNGHYVFPRLHEGSFVVTAFAPDGRTADGAIDVMGGRASRLNFVVLPHTPEGILPSLAGVAVDESLTPNPDANGNGVVDLEDLQAARDDGDAVMIHAVEQYFGRAVLLVPGEYEALVTPGGTRYRIGDDFDAGESLDGSTTGVLTTAGSPTLVRYEVTEDTGTAISQQFGPFNFQNHPDSPSFIVVDLDSGVIQDGSLSLRLAGPAFPDVSLHGAIHDGFIALAPHGFARYHFGVMGAVPPSVPLLGGMVFCASKSSPPPPDKLCAQKDLSACVRGGKVCQTDDASCSVGGKAGKCKSQVTAMGRCSCECK